MGLTSGAGTGDSRSGGDVNRCQVPDEYLLKSKRPLLFGREVLTAVVAHWIHPDTTC